MGAPSGPGDLLLDKTDTTGGRSATEAPLESFDLGQVRSTREVVAS